MIAERHPEEKRRKRRPEADQAKKYSYDAESDPFQLVRMPDSAKRRPRDRSAGFEHLDTLHPLLDDDQVSNPHLILT